MRDPPQRIFLRTDPPGGARRGGVWLGLGPGFQRNNCNWNEMWRGYCTVPKADDGLGWSGAQSVGVAMARDGPGVAS